MTITTVDIIILVIIAVYALLGLRRGFAATVAYTLGSLAALIGALAAAARFKQPVGTLLAPFMQSTVSQAIPELSQVAGSAIEAWDDVSSYLQGILTAHGVSLDVLDNSEHPQEVLSNAIAQSAGEAIAYIIIFIAVFLLIKLLLHVIMSALGIITHLPVIHSFNALAGGLLGAVTGLVLCTCVLWALKLFAPTVYSDVGVLSPSVMQNSSIARYLVGWNDGVSLFETTPADA